MTTQIGNTALNGWDEDEYKAALKAEGYPAAPDPDADQLRAWLF